MKFKIEIGTKGFPPRIINCNNYVYDSTKLTISLYNKEGDLLAHYKYSYFVILSRL